MKTIISIILTSFLLILSACSDNDENIENNENTNEWDLSQYQSTMEQTLEWINTEEFDELASNWEYKVIDIRSPYELESTWVIWDNTKNIEYYSDNFIDELSKLDRHDKYLIYCNSWNRTSDTLRMMEELGFSHAKHLEWWIQAWMMAQKPTINCNDTQVC